MISAVLTNDKTGEVIRIENLELEVHANNGEMYTDNIGRPYKHVITELGVKLKTKVYEGSKVHDFLYFCRGLNNL